MAGYCLRCGKAAHKGKCTFDKTKKSVLEESNNKISAVSVDVDAMKKVK